jgi:deoxyribonuclease V
MTRISNAIILQQELSKKIISKNILPKNIQEVCGVDVSYKGNTAYCSAVIINKKNLKTIESVNLLTTVTTPYIPGLFMLRESRPILNTLDKLKNNFDLLLVDGHGKLHPRKCGLACYIGLAIDKPVVGVGKSLLCGKIRSDRKVEFQGKVLGYTLIHNSKKIFVSIGHKISLKTAVKLTNELILSNQWYPEPLRLADKHSKQFRNSKNT